MSLRHACCAELGLRLRGHDLRLRRGVVLHDETVHRAFEVPTVQDGLRQHVHRLPHTLLGELTLGQLQTLLPDVQVVIAQLLKRVLDLGVNLLI